MLDNLNGIYLEKLSEDSFNVLNQLLREYMGQFGFYGVVPKELRPNDSKYVLRADSRIIGPNNDTDPHYQTPQETFIDGLDAVTIIGFSPGDGTGSKVNYPKVKGPAQNIARDKPGLTEICVPMGSYIDGVFLPGLVNLDEVTLKDGHVRKFKEIGIIDSDEGPARYNYEQAVKMFRKYGGAVYSFKAFELTFLNSPADLRTNIFGNPHAIRFNPNRVGNTHPFYKHWIQLAAFIPVPAYSEMAHDLIRATPPIIIEKYSRPD